ncbi:MAG: amidohydrolase [Streptomyces sp.]|uniref:amidohydrolase n=1 Tax=Streptomyces sp. TaxID=1931 RepID=UPI003D6B4BA1
MPGLSELVDQHSYGVLHADLGLGTFETHLAAATGGSVPAGGTLFDSRLGLELLRWCPPLLGLEPHCSPARYLARRREMGAYRAARALLRGTGISCFLVDTTALGDRGPCPGPHGLSSPGELAAAAAGSAREAVGLGALAEQVADTSGSVRAFVSDTAEALHGAARGAVAFTCAADFREERPPGLYEVQRAADRWLRARSRRTPGPESGTADPSHCPADTVGAEPALVRHLLWGALVTGRPVQLHCGDPAPLAGFLRAGSGLGNDVVLLTRRPYHRVAARLAAAYPHVYADIGPRPAETLAEAPFGKLLFSSGARALPELYVVRARTFVRALEELLTEWVADGGCTGGDAVRIARQIASGTARRIYRLEAAVAG